jgi:hypothetical protein
VLGFQVLATRNENQGALNGLAVGVVAGGFQRVDKEIGVREIRSRTAAIAGAAIGGIGLILA